MKNCYQLGLFPIRGIPQLLKLRPPFRLTYCFLLIAVFYSAPAFAQGGQPINDDWPNALPIACGGTATGTTSFALDDGDGSCGVSDASPDVWYSIEGNGGNITASLCSPNTNYDTVLEVFTDVGGPSSSIVCNDDACLGVQSQVTWPSVPSEPYLIRVSGFGGSAGDFELNVTCESPPCDDGLVTAFLDFSDNCRDPTYWEIRDENNNVVYTNIGEACGPRAASKGNPKEEASGRGGPGGPVGEQVCLDPCLDYTLAVRFCGPFFAPGDDLTRLGGCANAVLRDENGNPIATAYEFQTSPIPFSVGECPTECEDGQFAASLETFFNCNSGGATWSLTGDDGFELTGTLGNTSPPPTGACFYPKTINCIDDVDLPSCIFEGGIYLGDGSTCAGGPITDQEASLRGVKGEPVPADFCLDPCVEYTLTLTPFPGSDPLPPFDGENIPTDNRLGSGFCISLTLNVEGQAPIMLNASPGSPPSSQIFTLGDNCCVGTPKPMFDVQNGPQTIDACPGTNAEAMAAVTYNGAPLMDADMGFTQPVGWGATIMVYGQAFTAPTLAQVSDADNADGELSLYAFDIIYDAVPSTNLPCVRTIQIVWAVTDPCDNLAMYSQDFTIAKQTPLSLPYITPEVNVECASLVPTPVDLTAVDACEGPITVAPNDEITQFVCDNQYAIIRTWTFTNSCGVSDVVEQIITINDVTAPNITACPAGTTVECIADIPAADPGSVETSEALLLEAEDADLFGGTAVASNHPGYTGTGFVDYPNNFGDGVYIEWTFNRAFNSTETVYLQYALGIQGGGPIPRYLNMSVNGGADILVTFNGTGDWRNYATVTVPNVSFTAGVNTIRLTANAGIVGPNFDHLRVGSECGDAQAATLMDIANNGGAGCVNDPYELTYTYEVKDNCGNPSTCTQTITVINNEEPTISVVPELTFDCFEAINLNPNWADVTTGCENTLDYDVVVTGPAEEIDADNCPGTTYTYTYTVTDVCDRTAQTTQLITIENEGPTMDCPDNCEVFGCFDGQAQAVIDAWINTVTATSSCSDQLTVGNTYHDNGSILNGNCIWDGITPVTFYAEDDCERRVECNSLIIIMDDDAPEISGTPSELLVPCTANTDEIFANWIATQGGVSAHDECGDVTWSTNPPNPEDLLDCESGPQAIVVEFIATDECGNSSSVTGIFNTKLLPLAVNVAGLIQTEAAEAVASVEVSAYQSSGMMAMDISNDAGDYGFEELPYEEDTQIVPARDGDWLNGLSTYDLIILQQHILGIQELDSPYKRIAADANRSGSISTLDLVLFRRLVLHLDEELADNTSWRFVDADYIFPNPENPFETDFPEIYVLSGEEEEWANFVAVKIGDLNLDAETNSFGTSEDRSGLAVLEVQAEDQQLQAGQTYEVELSAANFTAINGFQFTLDFDRTAIEILDIQSADLADFDAQHYGLAKVDAGAVTISWNTNNAQSLNPEEAIFSVVLRAQSDVQLSEALSITSAYTKAEAYQSGTLMNVNLNFSNNGTTILTQSLRLYQNQPNPFKDATMIGFDLPKASAVDFMIYDVTGKLVYRTQGDFAAGYNQIELDRSNLPGGGVFYYHVQTEEDSASKKMIFMD